jgi:predicted membrane GTPase involved in stress response
MYCPPTPKPSLASEATGIQLEARLRMSLQPTIDYIGSDELVETTPNSLRLRKRIYAVTYGKWIDRAQQTAALEAVS